jgi:hypothetical protein
MIHLNLDDAWEERPLGMDCVDAREWGPRVRYFAPQWLLAQFYDGELKSLPPFLLYGSGDFHHLTSWLVRRVVEPVTLVSFDNHPDWDVRPPQWTCGGWVNRALELEQVNSVSVWGCGNFEVKWPGRIFGNRRAVRDGRLKIYSWRARVGDEIGNISRNDWRGAFEDYVGSLAASAVYVTVDLDCLRQEEAVTNWENGLFEAEDVAWAIALLKEKCRVIAGDVCGAYSVPKLERWTQKVASWWDHPKIGVIDLEEARRRNVQALETLRVMQLK